MTDVEITPQADDQVEQLEPEARERILKNLAEALVLPAGEGSPVTDDDLRAWGLTPENR